jgi:hypothetical protein
MVDVRQVRELDRFRWRKMYLTPMPALGRLSGSEEPEEGAAGVAAGRCGRNRFASSMQFAGTLRSRHAMLPEQPDLIAAAILDNIR